MTQATGLEVSSFKVEMERRIDAPIGVVFEAVLAEMGPEGEMPGGEPFPMVLEAWPGGRWFRDLGEGRGHLWGHVQVIKAPALLEICGPMFMSYAASNHVQYRLREEGGRVVLKITHSAVGLIDPEHAEGVTTGWGHGMDRIKMMAESRAR